MKPIRQVSLFGATAIGLTDVARRTPDMPLYTLKKTATGDSRVTRP